MNHLNSVLLEGVVQEGIETWASPHGLPYCSFKIESVRFRGSAPVEKPVFDIVTCNKLAEDTTAKISTGRQVRIVGRLAIDAGKVIVNADHIEYKAIFQ